MGKSLIYYGNFDILIWRFAKCVTQDHYFHFMHSIGQSNLIKIRSWFDPPFLICERKKEGGGKSRYNLIRLRSIVSIISFNQSIQCIVCLIISDVWNKCWNQYKSNGGVGNYVGPMSANFRYWLQIFKFGISWSHRPSDFV